MLELDAKYFYMNRKGSQMLILAMKTALFYYTIDDILGSFVTEMFPSSGAEGCSWLIVGLDGLGGGGFC